MIILDTHVLIWAIHGDPRLGSAAKRALDPPGRERSVGVSAITPWEIAFLSERGRLRLDRGVGEWIDAALAVPGISLLPIEPGDRDRKRTLAGILPGRPGRSVHRRHGTPPRGPALDRRSEDSGLRRGGAPPDARRAQLTGALPLLPRAPPPADPAPHPAYRHARTDRHHARQQVEQNIEPVERAAGQKKLDALVNHAHERGC